MRTATLLTSLTLSASLGCSPFLVPRPPDRATWSQDPPPTCETRDWPVAVDLTIAAAALTGAAVGAYHWNDKGPGFGDIIARLMVFSYTPIAAGFGWSGYAGYSRNADCRELKGYR
jgi:hypothetical protein